MKWALVVISVEALTELLLHSTLLNSPRSWLSRRPFFKSLFECGWCLSIWVSLFVFGLLLLRLEIILLPICLHRMSNYVHVFYSLVKYKFTRRP